MAANSVELGFVEERAPWKLMSKFFPSKVGGRPAWLRLDNLPIRENLTCSVCKKPLVFLMQIYAPIPELDPAFHRTIFIFMCVDGKCSNQPNGKTFAVYRSQLPRKNKFYSFDPPVYKEKLATDPSAEQFLALCSICGVPASVKCTKCDSVSYCCENHLSLDWENNHKHVCGKEGACGAKPKSVHCLNRFNLPQYELVTETEELPTAEPEKSEEIKMKEFQLFMKSSKAPKEFQDVPMDDVDNVLKRKDKAFNKFKKRVDLEPEQVLRYQRKGSPLWVSSEHVPSPPDIPNCSCGSERIFELQVMPQLLNYLSLDGVQDSIDWGTLAVYTCAKSCNMGTESYVEEFLWKQDFSDVDK